jgi:D-serine deaminase-like pyridoxal phosphate-dependent protein
MITSEIPTPALLIEFDVLERNLRFMQGRADALKVALRPHIKTHKCIEIALRQRAFGAKGITVSTFYEARQFAAAGFTDLTWAFPVPFIYAPRVLELAEETLVRVVVDGLETTEHLEGVCARAGKKLHVWLKVDTGYQRAGVDPQSPYAEKVLRALNGSKFLIFDGILSHMGSTYHACTREEILPHAAQERAVMVEFAERMRSKGYSVPEVSIGSTPGMNVVENLDGVTEVRPGNYVFHDYTQAAIGSCRLDDCALSVLASVISHQPAASYFLIDSGALALSKDLGPVHAGKELGFGAVYEDYRYRRLHADIQLQSVSQEIGKVVAAGSDFLEGRFKVGDRVRILENHACLTSSHFDRYYVVRGEEVIDEWNILRGRI